jgi:hypothetical protein
MIVIGPIGVILLGPSAVSVQLTGRQSAPTGVIDLSAVEIILPDVISHPDVVLPLKIALHAGRPLRAEMSAMGTGQRDAAGVIADRLCAVRVEESTETGVVVQRAEMSVRGTIEMI